jgi:hypothetical protein
MINTTHLSTQDTQSTYWEEDQFTVSATFCLKLELHSSHGNVFVGTLLTAEAIHFKNQDEVGILVPTELCVDVVPS